MDHSNFLRRSKAGHIGSSTPALKSVGFPLVLLLVGAAILLTLAGATLTSRGPFGHGHSSARPLPSWPESNTLVAQQNHSTDARASLTVRFRAGTSTAMQHRLLARFGAEETSTVRQLGLHIVAVDPSKAQALLDALRSSRTVSTATPDDVRQVAGGTSATAIAGQWALKKIGAATAQNVKSKRNVTIAVLDTGVDGSALAGHLVAGHSALAGSNASTDPNGHGTWMASIALAADPAAHVMPVQVLNAHGLGKDSDIIEGLIWAADHHANVILMSFAGKGYSPALQRAIDYAWSKGAVVVAATGNAGSKEPTYPAGDAKVIGVSATDQSDHLWSGSNFGTDTFLAAPGVGVVANAIGGGTTSVTGTSTSAALVAGSAALLVGSGRTTSNADVAGRLAASAHRAGNRSQTGNGRLDLARALKLRNTKPLVPAGVRGREAGGPFAGPYLIASTLTGPTVAGSGTLATAVTTLAVTTNLSAVPVNSTIFVVAAQNFSSATPITAIDSGGNTYSNVADSNNATGTKHVALLRARVTTALTTASTVTITFPGATAVVKAATVFFVNGLSSTADGAVGATTGSSASATATTGATAQAADFVVGGVSTGTVGAGNNSCTALTAAGTSPTAQEEPVYKTVAATGAQTCGAAVTSAQWAAVVAAYKIDGTAPSAAVTGPAGNSSGYNGSIAGTATDEVGGSGIDTAAGKTQLSIYDSTTTKYWTGAAWSAAGAGETYINATTQEATTAGSAQPWSYTFAAGNFTSGDSYTIHTTVTDLAGNASTVGTKTFTWQTGTAAPTVAGTGATTATAVATLTVTLASSAVPVNSTVFVVATQNINSATPITAVDNAGNTYTNDADTVNATGTKHVAILRAKVVTALTTASTVTITFPSATAAVKAATVFFVNGPVTTTPLDGTSGVATGNSAFAAATTGATTQAADFVVGGVSIGTVGSGTNSCVALTAAGTAGTAQEVPVYKTVNTTGAQTCGAAVTSGQWAAVSAAYKFDSTAPTAAVTGPSGYSGGYNGSIAGTATDEAAGSGIDIAAGQTRLSIYDVTADKYWTGAAWSAQAASETYVSATTQAAAATGSAAPWSYTFAAGNFTVGHSYTIHATATDYAGNDSAVASNTFTWRTGNTGPTVAGTNLSTTNAATVAVTLTLSAVPVNSTIFVVATNNASSATPITASDSVGNTYTNDADSNNVAGTKHVAILRAKVTTALTTAGIVTITFPVSSTAIKAATVFFVNGPVTTTPLDGTSGAATGNTASAAATTGATTQAADFVVGGVSTATLSTGNNSCVALTAAGTAGTAQEEPVYKSVNATGAQTCGAAVTSGQWAAVAAAYKFDTTSPVAAITTPSAAAYTTPGWTNIAGTATDESGGSGIDVTAGQTKVSIYDVTVDKYWTGGGWSAAAAPETYNNVTSQPTAVTPGSAAPWSYTFSSLTDGHSYVVHATTTDYAGNVSVIATKSFDYDTQAPTAAALTTNGIYNATGFPASLTGTTSDATTGSHGISAVNVSIKDSTSGKCWNATNFTTAACPNWIAVTSGGTATLGANASWSYATTGMGAQLTNGDTYTVEVQATDATTAGNQSLTLSAGTFVYDSSAPATATLTTNGVYNTAGWSGHVDGTTTDLGTGSHGISAVNVSIADSVSGKCWNGTNFTTATCPNWIAVSTGGTAAAAANASWQYNLASAALVDAHTYTVSVQATDATTSGTQSGTLAAGTFKYDTTAPAFGTLSYVLNGNCNSKLFASGATMYYNPAAAACANAFEARAVVTDATAGPASVNFPAIALGSFAHTNETVSGASPYTSALHYGWSATSANFSSTSTLTATDAAGNTSTTSLAITLDTSPPTSGTISVPAYVTSASVPITSGNYTDSGSGIATNVLTRSNGQSPVAGLCPAVITFTGSTVVTSPDTTVVDGQCYVYTLTGTDNVGNAASVATTNAVLVDTTKPGDAFTLTAQTGVFKNAGTIYYKGDAAGSFKLRDTVTDAASGPASTTVGLLSGLTGASHSAETISTPAGGPYDSTAISWTAASGTGSLAAHGTDAAGNSQSDTPFTLTLDNTAPGGGVISVPPTVKTLSVAITTTPATDGGSGLAAATNTISRSDGQAVSGNTCPVGSYTGSNAIAASPDTSVVSGQCYVYTLTATDHVGNVATWTSSPVLIDTVAPSDTFTLTSVTGGVYKNSATIYYKGDTAGSFKLRDTVTDALSGPASTTFGLLTGFTGATHTAETVSTPAGGPYDSTAISWATASGTGSLASHGTDAATNSQSDTTFT
ncbi:MAG: thermitase, partial [Actinomycetota bacterium]|nr:thermitase [Actinomycetota bacterium]